jgi:SAM-dependent methyltransferase
VESCYFDKQRVKEIVAAGGHRDIVGGAWDEIGELQFEFVKGQGLAPQHRLLDVGCGSLRAGIHFVRYLNRGNYFGVDMNESLLDAGYNIELENAGLRERLTRQHLLCTGDFNLDGIPGDFDFALAQSLFTHLTFNRIRQCLERLSPKMKPHGRFYATFFELPADVPAHIPLSHSPGGVITHDVEDPYHYRLSDLRHAAKGLPWELQYIGDWRHPRAQRMVLFVRSCMRCSETDVL